ncbi:MAG: hypothetical protein Q8R12_02760 [bacterium]|nr:hypothetical protein [bacterium]
MFELAREFFKEILAEAQEEGVIWPPLVGFAAFAVMVLLQILVGVGETIFPD